MPNLSETDLQAILTNNKAIKLKANKGDSRASATQKVLRAYEASETSAKGTESPEKRSKYGNRKVEIDGVRFDSVKESNYYLFLKSELEAGRINKLELQPEFPIEIKGTHICLYKADFRVTYPDGRKETIDVKGMKTPVYRLKKKLVEAKYLIKIIEI